LISGCASHFGDSGLHVTGQAQHSAVGEVVFASQPYSEINTVFFEGLADLGPHVTHSHNVTRLHITSNS